MKSTLNGNRYFVLSDNSVLALYFPNDYSELSTDDQPVMSIACYNQEEHGMRIIHDEEEITFDKMEVKKIMEFIPTINELLSKKLHSNKSMFLSDQEDVAFAQEYIQWLHEENNDFVVTISASVEKLHDYHDKKRGKKKKLEEDNQQHYEWGCLDSFNWRRVIKYDAVKGKVL